jgi:hypothetical protein
MPRKPLMRAFKTAWFSKSAGKARIGDPVLIAAIGEVMLAQAFGRMTDSGLASALSQGDLLELCDEE